MNRYKTLPSREFLLQTYMYDPETGQFCWAADSRNGQRFRGDQAGGVRNGAGHRIKIQGKVYPLPRIIWLMHTGDDPGEKQVDHINGNVYDNRFTNLRLATYSENQANSTCSREGRTLPRGVYRRGSTYRAMIKANGKIHCLGAYDTPEGAQQAWLEKAKELWGDFATDRNSKTCYSNLGNLQSEPPMPATAKYPSLRQVSLMAEKAGIGDLASANKLVQLTLDAFGGITHPVSVAERLPGPEDCDAEGRCWVWWKNGVRWVLDDWTPADFRSEIFCDAVSHWLPHCAIPIPSNP